MKKPLVYYQFDNEKFRQSHHQIGYFDFRKDGFGPVCVTEQEVTDWLIRLHKQGFANEEIYLERHGKYFDLWVQRIVKEITKRSKKCNRW